VSAPAIGRNPLLSERLTSVNSFCLRSTIPGYLLTRKPGIPRFSLDFRGLKGV